MKFIRTKYPEKYYDYDGIRIRYIDTGGDGEPIVFLHGLGGKVEDNDLIYEQLESRYRVICMDEPGSGYSDKPAMEYSITSMAEFSLDFARRLGVEKMLLAGGSQGGLLTLLCCRMAPERVRKAAVYSAAGMFNPSPLLVKLFRTLPPEAVRLFMRGSSLFWNSPFYPGFLEERARALDFIDKAEQPGFGMHVFGCLASQFEMDFRQIYSEVETPVLIFWGSHDFAMPQSMGREIHSLVRNSRLLELPGVGHNAFSERPEFCAAKLIEFFDGE